MQQSSRFNKLDNKAKVILDNLIISWETLAQSLQEQEETNQQRHIESREFVESQHTETRTGVIVAVNGAAASTCTQFQLMREEIEIVGNTVAKNQQDILRILEEVNRLAQDLA